MKVTELMIGDIVMFKHQHYPTRIKVIDNTHRMPFEDMKVPGWVKYGGLEDIEPIPLTHEILEKNGFVFRGDNDTMCGEYYLHNQSTFAIKMFNGYLVGMCMSEDLEFNYAHELQHALRLCGLDDLADNFKV